ncbi:bifunctional phosphopantothenoylcysteine decarboxylase/phosphopantothenate--cysteine ligase CoaBC [uncultured Thiodictyon sp.]|uniref:bifunctional phosphopantothenoylcysteine decarboxylase/phosphopantothenate--cysteine ligase CoaBC n=1 Tax=uncultured Thiodictyon sp. TaxID=1846217 RepID=UPI0025F5E543|nr:bifunctional phosphopantothenoylcysteine decarboxylase/phosphopantothenate--cysteine ligase CoaBC [uncultured Thiodictyon sp.]
MVPIPGMNILLGVSGGIAAYKAADLVRRLRERGCAVRVVMTAAATAFVSPLTFQALSGHPVRTGLLDPAAEAGMDHIELARWADRVLLAPATADLIARLAAGLADDLLTTLVLATAAPLYLAPAMNQQMWRHPATQENLERLRRRGVQVLGPGVGSQACGEQGPGRMLEPAELVTTLLAADRSATKAAAGPLAGVRAMVTAGPTREPLDPVRYLGNRSSGRMGYAVAEALAGLGAAVTLISGPTALPTPTGVLRVDVETAREMHSAVLERIAGVSLFVAAAAVADYRPADPVPQKIKKVEAELVVRLVRNPDILAEVAAQPSPPFTVGFAAETDQVEDHALTKLRTKRLHMIAANRVGGAVGGFERNDNALTVLWPDGRRELPMMPKTQLARELALLIAERYVASS